MNWTPCKDIFFTFYNDYTKQGINQMTQRQKNHLRSLREFWENVSNSTTLADFYNAKDKHHPYLNEFFMKNKSVLYDDYIVCFQKFRLQQLEKNNFNVFHTTPYLD